MRKKLKARQGKCAQDKDNACKGKNELDWGYKTVEKNEKVREGDKKGDEVKKREKDLNR